MANPYGSLPTPVTVAATLRFFRSMIHTVPGTPRAPPEIAA
jgi:hypothetical protein